MNVCRKKNMPNIILGVILVVITLMGFCLSTNAQESTKVYNRNDEVVLSHGLFMHNGKNFIHLSDLHQLGLNVIEEEQKYTITSNDALGEERKLIIKIKNNIEVITPGSGDITIIQPTSVIETPSVDLMSAEEVTVNTVSWLVTYTSRSTETIGNTGGYSVRDDTLLDDFPINSYYYTKTDDMIKVNNEYYISAQYIGNKLSHGYSEKNGRIDFYFATLDSVLTETIINFASKKAEARSANIYTAYKTGEQETIDDFEILSKISCTVLENEKSVNCLIETPAEKIGDKNIYLIVDFGERYFLAYDKFDFSKVGNINVYGEQKDVTYTVTVNLPEVDEYDVPFTVYVSIGNNTYSKQGVIKSGETSQSVEISGLPKRRDYETYIKFDYNKFKNVCERIIFLNKASGDFTKDFTAEYSRMVLCTVSLPDNFSIDGDVELELKLSNYIKSGSVYIPTPLTHWSDTKTILLNEENPSEQVCLYSQDGASVLSYNLISDIDELNGKGFLGSEGKTTSDYNQSKAITDDSIADIQLLKKKTIDVTIIRPTSLSVENDIFASVELDDKSTILYGDKIIDFTANPLIPSGELSSSFELNIPEDKSYRLKITNITGDNNLFDYCCYVDCFSSNAEENKMALITFNDESINLNLIRCKKVSGIIDCDNSDLNFMVKAYCSLYNDRILELKSNIEDGKFTLKIPVDANSYLLAVQTKVGKNSYYVSDGVSTNDENKATKIRFEDNEDSEYVLEYIVQNPDMPIDFFCDVNNEKLNFKNISDYNVEADVYVAYYDRYGRMLSVEKLSNTNLKSGLNYVYFLNLSNYEIYNVKPFAWKKDELIPLGNIIRERINKSYSPKQD